MTDAIADDGRRVREPARDPCASLLAQVLLTSTGVHDPITTRPPAPHAASAPAASAAHGGSHVPYRPEIDGLRAVAVVPVVLFHMGVVWMTGGYIGVDVFFVISGYLITSIVLAELDRGTFSFRTFWARRIRRIVPALLLVTACTLLATVALVFKPDRPEIGRQALASLLSVANLYFWRRTGDYWGTAAEETPFLHMWSLAVEEQFYLLLPLGVWLLARQRQHRLIAGLLSVVVISLAAFLYGVEGSPTFTFYSLPTRAWELATGCVLASLVREGVMPETPPRTWSPLGTAGLALVLCSMLLLPRLGAGLAIAVVGAALVLAFARHGVAYQLLASRPAVHVGRLSYSLYLWHWPVLVFANYLRWRPSKLWLLIPLYALARLSQALVEEPARKRGAVVPIMAMFVLVLAAAVYLAVAPARYDTSAFQTPQWHGTAYDIKPRAEMSDDFAVIMADVAAAPRRASPTAYRSGGVLSGPAGLAPVVVVLGDSHGAMWSETIRRATDRLGVPAAFMSINGVTPFPSVPVTRQPATRFLSSDERYAYDTSRLAYIDRWRPAVVIVAARWAAENRQHPDDLLAFLATRAGRVFLLEQPPELADVGNRSVIQYLAYRGIRPASGRQTLPIGNADEVRRGRQLVQSLAQRFPRCAVLPIHDRYIGAGGAVVVDGRRVLYFDDDHLTTDGTELARPVIESALREALRTSTRGAPAVRMAPTALPDPTAPHGR